jgi:hypothetical protein
MHANKSKRLLTPRYNLLCGLRGSPDCGEVFFLISRTNKCCAVTRRIHYSDAAAGNGYLLKQAKDTYKKPTTFAAACRKSRMSPWISGRHIMQTMLAQGMKCALDSKANTISNYLQKWS